MGEPDAQSSSSILVLWSYIDDGSGIYMSFNLIVSEEGSTSDIIVHPWFISSSPRVLLSNVHTCSSSCRDSLALASSSSTAISTGGPSLDHFVFEGYLLIEIPFIRVVVLLSLVTAGVTNSSLRMGSFGF